MHFSKDLVKFSKKENKSNIYFYCAYMNNIFRNS